MNELFSPLWHAECRRHGAGTRKGTHAIHETGENQRDMVERSNGQTVTVKPLKIRVIGLSTHARHATPQPNLAYMYEVRVTSETII